MSNHTLDDNNFAESFIEAVRNHPALWDFKSVLYKSRVEKDKAWKSIAQEFGYDSDDINCE